MKRASQHLRSNAIAYLALFVALGGTGYAAISLPRNSVGPQQLRDGAVTSRKLANGAVTPAKVDGRAIGGVVLHWAHVSQAGRLLGGSRGARVTGVGPQYNVTWGSEFQAQCAVLVTPAAVPGIAPIANSTGVGVNDPGPGKGGTIVYVWTYNNNAPTPAPFFVAVIC